MAATIIKIDPARPEEAYSQCREVVASGGVIAYPTDTFYGLGADPENPVAVKRLFEIKGRQKDQPILLLIADPADAARWAAEITAGAAELMKRFWPGPLTLVFSAKAGRASGADRGHRDHRSAGPRQRPDPRPARISGPCPHRHEREPLGPAEPRTARETAEELGDLVDLVLDGGETAGGNASTVVDVTAEAPRVIREGAVPAQGHHWIGIENLWYKNDAIRIRSRND